MAAHHRPKTRLQTESEQLRLCHLPEACLSHVVALAARGAPWKERCRLAEVCRTFRQLFAAQAFAGDKGMCLDLNTLSWKISERKRKAAARSELLGALSRYAPSVTRLTLKYQLDRFTGLSLSKLLAPLAPRVRHLHVEDGLCGDLLEALGAGNGSAAVLSIGNGKAGNGSRGGSGTAADGASGSSGSGACNVWPALEEVELVGCNLWIDLEPAELAALDCQLAAAPVLASKIHKFECSCQGMKEGDESFFTHLTGLRSLELEDWMGWEQPRDYTPLLAMPHLSRLVLNIVEDLQAHLPSLLALTQVRELSLQGCYHSCRELTQLTNLVVLELQEIGLEPGNGPADLAAAWKVGSLTELRWCGDVRFDRMEEAPIQLPRLQSLEIDEAYFPPSGLYTQLVTSLTTLTSLRLVGGRCPRLPHSISLLQNLQVLAIDSCQMPAMPAAISTLSSVTNLMLSNASLSHHLPAWVLHLPIRKLWLANNQLSTLLPTTVGSKGGAAAFAERQLGWLSRLTHVCLSANSLKEVPLPLLEHATALEELDLAYNHQLQITAKAVDLLRHLTSLRLLRLEKSYWLRLEDRWSRASLRAIAGLQRERPDLRVNYDQHTGAGSVRMAW